MQLYYAPQASHPGFEFDRDESKHLVRVLRHSAGDRILVTDGKGGRFTCEIAAAADKKVEVTVLESDVIPRRKAALTLAVAPTKNMDRMEWLVEKAVEIGVERMVPLLCHHSERKVIKPERLQRIAVSAMKQSQRCFLPAIDGMTSFESLLRQENEGQRFICHLPEDNGAEELHEQLAAGQSATILIGPEGDFSPGEIALAREYGCTMTRLGLSRLRTETAALTAVVTFAMHNPSAQ